MKTGVIYSRVSSTSQDYSRQLSDIKRYCDFNEIEIKGEFSEKESGKVKVRPALTSMINFIKENEIQFIIISELSRLGRTNQILQDIDLFTSMKVCLISMKENIKTLNDDLTKNASAELIYSILSGINKFELSTIKYRVESGTREGVKNGHFKGNRIPFGYTKVNKVLTIDETESKVIETIYTRFLNGEGVSMLKTYLNSVNDLKPRLGDKWTQSTIYYILTNTLYKGVRNFNGETFDCPAIIEPSVFDRVQELLKSKNNKKGIHQKYEYLLDKGFLVCGVCGRHYHAIQRGNGRTDNTYNCISRTMKQPCGNVGISIKKLEKNVVDIVTIYGQDAILSSLNTDKIDKEINNLKNELEQISDSLKNNQKQESQLVDLILSDLMTKSIYEVKIKGILEDKKNLEKLFKQVNEKLGVAETTKQNQMNRTEVIKKIVNEGINKSVIRNIIDEIKITPNERKLSKDTRDKTVEVFIRMGEIEISFLISQRSDKMKLTETKNVNMEKFLNNMVHLKMAKSLNETGFN